MECVRVSLQRGTQRETEYCTQKNIYMYFFYKSTITPSTCCPSNCIHCFNPCFHCSYVSYSVGTKKNHTDQGRDPDATLIFSVSRSSNCHFEGQHIGLRLSYLTCTQQPVCVMVEGGGEDHHNAILDTCCCPIVNKVYV